MSYRGNRYSVPHVHAGRSVMVREPLDSGTIRVFYQQELIAEHRLSSARGVRRGPILLSRLARLPVRCSPLRRAKDTGLKTADRQSSFRAIVITDYLENGGDINIAKHMAGHSNIKTTELYDARGDEVSFSEIERLGFDRLGYVKHPRTSGGNEIYHEIRDKTVLRSSNDKSFTWLPLF